MSTTYDADNDTAPSRNQISRKGILISGIVFILLFIITTSSLIILWPDRMPEPNRNMINYPPIYIMDSSSFKLKLIDTLYFTKHTHINTLLKLANEIEELKAKPDSTKLVQEQLSKITHLCHLKSQNPKCSFHLNHLLFILVTLGGFIGSLIHTASSFTTFVGLRKFKRSWLMWYYVKPFIASALALAVYVVYRSGFPSISFDGANINPYGIVSLAILTGLFSRAITDKLEKILDVIFPETKQSVDSVDEAVDSQKTVKLNDTISPEQMEKGKEETFTISGENLDKLKKLSILINQDSKEHKVTANSITFKYSLEENDPATEVKVEVMAEVKEKEKTIKTYTIKLKDSFA